MTHPTPAVDGRTRHYGHFYGLDEPEGDGGDEGAGEPVHDRGALQLVSGHG